MTALKSSQLGYVENIITAYNKELSEVDASLRSAPYEHGFSLEDWEVITNFQILKEVGVYEVKKREL